MCLLSAFSSIFSSWNNRNNQIFSHHSEELHYFGYIQASKPSTKRCLTVPSMSESSSDGLKYSFLFLFLMGFRWSGLRDETLPPAGTFSTAELLLRCRKQTRHILIYSGVWFTFNITNAIKIDWISTCDLLNVVSKKGFQNMREAAVTCQCLDLCGAPLRKSSEPWDRGSVVPHRPELQVWQIQTALTPRLRLWLRWLAPPHLAHKAKRKCRLE